MGRKTARRYNPEDHNRNIHRHDNLKPKKENPFFRSNKTHGDMQDLLTRRKSIKVYSTSHVCLSVQSVSVSSTKKLMSITNYQ
jgi:hypothetical protein